MAYAALGHIGARSAGDSVTTGPLDTTGANLLVVSVGYSPAYGPAVVFDSKINTWISLTAQNAGGNAANQLYYCQGGTVGSGHTFSAALYQMYGSICVAAFSGSKVTPFDVENGATALTSYTLATGSTGTLAEDNELVVAGTAFAGDVGTPLYIDSGLTVYESQQFEGSVNIGSGLAYLIETTAAAINATWTLTNTEAYLAVTIATFKAAAAAGRVTKNTRAFPLGEAVGMGWQMVR